MNKTRLIFVMCMILLFFCITVLNARGGNERNKIPANTVRITGMVRLIGTGLFPQLVVTTDDGEWYISKDDMQALHALQHNTVTIEGEETVTELKFANGISAGTRRELANVKIIKIEQ